MTDKEDPRAVLARMEAEEIAAREKAETLATENAKKRDAILAELRAADLADVIAKCKMHGFSATDLRGALKVKGAKKSTPRKSTARRSTTTRRKKPAA